MRTVVGGGRDTHDGHENSPILVFFSNLLESGPVLTGNAITDLAGLEFRRCRHVQRRPGDGQQEVSQDAGFTHSLRVQKTAGPAMNHPRRTIRFYTSKRLDDPGALSC